MARFSFQVQALALAASSGFAQLITAVLYVVAARQLAAEDFGRVVASIALGTSAALIANFGTNAMWTRDLARDTRSWQDIVDRSVTKVLLVVVVGVAWAVAAAALGGVDAWIAPAILVSTTCIQTATVGLRARARNELVAVATVVERLAALVVFFGLSGVFRPDPSVFVGSLLAGTAAATAICVVASARAETTTGYRPALPWAGSGAFGISSIAQTLAGLDVVVLAQLGGPTAAGVYGAVNRWTQPLGLLSGAFSAAAVPFVAAAASTRSAWKTISGATWMLGLAVVVAVVLGVFAPTVVPLLLGDEYRSAAPVLRVLAFGTVSAILNQPLAAILQARGSERAVAIILIIAATFQLGLLALLVGALGPLAAAVAFLVTQALILCSLGVATARLTRFS